MQTIRRLPLRYSLQMVGCVLATLQSSTNMASFRLRTVRKSSSNTRASKVRGSSSAPFILRLLTPHCCHSCAGRIGVGPQHAPRRCRLCGDWSVFGRAGDRASQVCTLECLPAPLSDAQQGIYRTSRRDDTVTWPSRGVYKEYPHVVSPSGSALQVSSRRYVNSAWALSTRPASLY